jgi:hypothetical protein
MLLPHLPMKSSCRQCWHQAMSLSRSSERQERRSVYRLFTCLLAAPSGCSNDNRNATFSSCGLQLGPEGRGGGTLESTQAGQADALRVGNGANSSESITICNGHQYVSFKRTLFRACAETAMRSLLAGTWAPNRATAHGADASTLSAATLLLLSGSRQRLSRRTPPCFVRASQGRRG